MAWPGALSCWVPGTAWLGSRHARFFSTKRNEIEQSVESEPKVKLAADGVVLRSVIIGIVKDMAFAKTAARLGVRLGTLSDYARIVHEKMEV